MSALLGRILLVDDDRNITDLLKFNLESEGFGIDVVPMAKDVDVDKLTDYRLVIADCMKQSLNGMELIREAKTRNAAADVPVILCSEQENEDTIIDALECGAEDFIAKPFSLRELVARVKAILRRHPQIVAGPVVEKQLSLGPVDLDIDLEKQSVMADGVVLPLTKTEYSILLLLIRNRNSFFTRNDICKEVWKDEASTNERIVDTNISRLRKKLGERGKYIINRYGMGYAFVDKLK